MRKNSKAMAVAKSAMLVALSVIIGTFCKTFLNFDGGLLRITFENLPILMAGIIYGPVAGGVVGMASDLVSYFMSPQIYPPNLVVTLGATMVGVVAGLSAKFIVKRRGSVQIIVSVALAHIVGSMVIKTAGLFQYYQYLSFLRIPLYLVIGSIEATLLCVLLKRRSFAKVVGYLDSMKKDEALNYIHSVSWTFCKPGLERIGELCQKLGNPQNELKFIHVAGTNGKGSFCSMLSSVLISQGYRVGLYTSPYIRCFNERMQLNGEMIADSQLTEITEQIKPIADQMKDKPTEFELVTAIALEYFKREKCDYVVLECGLGGRLDSTNIVNTTVLSVITGIDLDHTSILGDTREKIAFEKAGIIKEGVPCLWCGNADNDVAFDVISKVAKDKKAPLYLVDRSSVNVKNATLEGTFFDFDDLQDVKISLLGMYQVDNAVNVISAAKALNEMGIAVSKESIYQGLASARWPARFEIISREPLVIFDGGHNPQGVSSCVDSVKAFLKDYEIIALTGVMADKDYRYIASRIGEVAKKVYCVTPDNPRALNAEDYAKVFSDLGVESHPCESIEEAVAAAIIDAKSRGAALVCLGSLYMYGEVEKEVKKATGSLQA